jgi:hypothetical protein
MKIILSSVLVAMMIVSCSSPAPTATPAPAIPPTETTAPTPTLTPTPSPLAVPLIYSGWADKAYAHVCVDGMTAFIAEEMIPGVTDVDAAALIIPVASDLLETMGMEVVPVGDKCEAQFTFLVSLEAEVKIEYRANGDTCYAYKTAELMGDLAFMAPPGGDGFVLPSNTEYKLPEEIWTCNEIPIPPYELVWPKAIVESFYKVYGDPALQAALSIEILQPFAEELIK